MSERRNYQYGTDQQGITGKENKTLDTERSENIDTLCINKIKYIHKIKTIKTILRI